MFRIEIIDKNEYLIYCKTFNTYGELMKEYKLIKDKDYSNYKNCTMQVFAGLNFENLKENKELEVML